MIVARMPIIINIIAFFLTLSSLLVELLLTIIPTFSLILSTVQPRVYIQAEHLLQSK